MTAAAIDIEARTLRITREFQAPVERVYDAFTKPEHLIRWWGPEGMTCPEMEMDVRIGGSWTTTMVNEKGERFTVSGVYTRLSPPTALTFTWGWAQDDGRRGHETTVTISLESTDTGTRLKLVQTAFQDSDSRDNHEGGWASSFNCLDAFLD